jgi:hypothetical protein
MIRRFISLLPRQIFALTLLAAFSTLAVQGQTVIINTPSTDVIPEKKVYVEMDFLTHIDSHQNGGYQTYLPRVMYGVAKGLEIGFNVAATDALAPNQPVEVQPNIKWQFYSNEKHGIAFSGGAQGFFTVANRTGADNFGMLYTNASKKITGTYGPRFSGGGYRLVGRAVGNGSLGGAMVGYEQPLHKKVTWINDWFSGKNRFGYVSSGFSIVPNSKTSIGVSYIVGNQGRANNGLFSWVGYTF